MNLNQTASTLENFPTVLHALLDNVDDALLRQRPAEGEWCVLEVIGHLIEADRDAFHYRVADIVAGNRTITPVSPTAPVIAKGYRDWAYSDLIGAFARERAISVEFVRSLSLADLQKSADHDKYGTFTAGDFIAEWPYHDMEHLSQIAANLQQPYPLFMSNTMRRALGID